MPFNDWNNPYSSQRLPVFARNVVATSQPLASQAGLRVLAQGGNAVDAAVATAATLTLVEPVSNGLGSDAFALIWDGSRLHGLNASGRSPQALTREEIARQGFDKMPTDGWLSVTVPGVVSGWVAALERFGSMPLSRVLEPAAEYA